ncbi:tyrosine-protein kinase family protein [Tepidibacter sp. Z1-5]|uniref:tyrosine-protein kinase family protein n=1 Tax=Tepidibacter sp. Z1-5 TaxID=3134138 RepID=UPI0030BB98A5
MKSIDVKKNIEKKLEKIYVTNKELEWVCVEIDGRNSINITITSDQIYDRKAFKKAVDEIIEMQGREYKKGLIRKYTVDEAKEYEIVKPRKEGRPDTLEKAVEFLNNPYKITKEKIFKSEVISFYSYKGGVGRTLSMIHTAYLLAKQGKNVLMMDLDIEAPSLHNIFKDEVSGLKYGLVDYMYNKIYDKGTDNKINVNEIYSKVDSGQTESFSGNLYVIPAGKITKEYIYKLSKIQPQLVSKRNYLSGLIKEIEGKQDLNLDMVLIDSRTGLNDWGAISLLGISDKVVFFTYPNNENIEGTKTLVELVKHIKEDNLTVVFSRGDKSGRNKANKLFESLELNQEYLEIIYDPNIAIANEFPIEKMLESCKPISDLLLEQERIEINRVYLERNQSECKELLTQLKSSLKGEFTVRTDSSPVNQIEKENIYLILSKSKNVLNYYINILYNKTYINTPYDKKSYNVIFTEKDKFTLPITDTKKILDAGEFNIVKDYIGKLGWDIIWHSYILYSINSKNLTMGIDELKGKQFNDYKEFVETYYKEEAMDKFTGIYRKMLRGNLKTDKRNMNHIINIKSSYNTKDYIQNFLILIQNVEWMKESKLIEALKELKNIKIFFENNNIPIDIKLFMEEKSYDENKEIYDEFKSNVFYLEWKKNDIENSIIDLLIYNKHIFESYMFALNNSKDALSFEQKMVYYELLKYLDNNDFKEELKNVVYDKKALLELFLGRRIKNGKYSKETIDWFFDKLKELDEINPMVSNTIIKKAISIELGKQKCTDRLISFDSLNKAFEEYKLGRYKG